jgi:hypothetical protein
MFMFLKALFHENEEFLIFFVAIEYENVLPVKLLSSTFCKMLPLV